MDFIAAAFSLFLLLLSAISALWFVLGIHRGAKVERYVPLVIEMSLALFLLGLAMLPQGFPSLFQRILGHSITSDYIHQQSGDGITVTETWISARWWRPLGTLFSLAMAIGIGWSIWNLRKRTERFANICALVLGCFWIAAILMNTLRSLLFR